MSRNKRDWTKYFKKIAAAIQKLPINNIILDGEIVILDKEHRSNFQLLQSAIHSKEEKHFKYYIFDMIYYNQYNLMLLPLLERKKLLQQVK